MSENLPPHKQADLHSRRQDEFTDIRSSLVDAIYAAGGQNWNGKWLIAKAIEELIDAKIAAATEKDKDDGR